MNRRRKSIRINKEERQLLQQLHRQSGIPDGQFPQRPAFWRQFTETWNEATDRDDSQEDLLHYIMTQRKQGFWFRFDGKYEPLSCPDLSLLSREQWAVVDAIYAEMKIAVDSLLVDPQLRRKLHAEFVKRTGTHVPELEFVASLVARRKGGWLPKLDPKDPGFGDIHLVA